MSAQELYDGNKAVVNYSEIKASLVLTLKHSDVPKDEAVDILDRLDAKVERDVDELVTELDIVEGNA